MLCITHFTHTPTHIGVGAGLPRAAPSTLCGGRMLVHHSTPAHAYVVVTTRLLSMRGGRLSSYYQAPSTYGGEVPPRGTSPPGRGRMLRITPLMPHTGTELRGDTALGLAQLNRRQRWVGRFGCTAPRSSALERAFEAPYKWSVQSPQKVHTAPTPRSTPEKNKNGNL